MLVILVGNGQYLFYRILHVKDSLICKDKFVYEEPIGALSALKRRSFGLLKMLFWGLTNAL